MDPHYTVQCPGCPDAVPPDVVPCIQSPPPVSLLCNLQTSPNPGMMLSLSLQDQSLTMFRMGKDGTKDFSVQVTNVYRILSCFNCYFTALLQLTIMYYTSTLYSTVLYRHNALYCTVIIPPLLVMVMSIPLR